jgi:hypothetical protein
MTLAAAVEFAVMMTGETAPKAHPVPGADWLPRQLDPRRGTRAAAKGDGVMAPAKIPVEDRLEIMELLPATPEA